MNIIIKDMLLVLIAFLGIPAGILISKYTKDEIKKGKIWMKILMLSCIILAGFVLAFNFQEEASLATLGFIFFLALVSLKKARKK